MDEAEFESALAAASAGAEWAFSKLWGRYQPLLLRYLAVAAPGAAEDLASETWLEIARDLDRFSGGAQSFKAWILTIARHQVIDYRRKGARRPAISGSLGEAPDPPGGVDPAAIADERWTTERALALIASLPADQAEAVALRVIAGLEVDEVARIMGKKPGHVRVLAHRGLRSLAQRFVTE